MSVIERDVCEEQKSIGLFCSVHRTESRNEQLECFLSRILAYRVYVSGRLLNIGADLFLLRSQQ